MEISYGRGNFVIQEDAYIGSKATTEEHSRTEGKVGL